MLGMLLVTFVFIKDQYPCDRPAGDAFISSP